MKKNHVWIIEVKTEIHGWQPWEWSVYLTKKLARLRLVKARLNLSLNEIANFKFRIKKYTAE